MPLYKITNTGRATKTYAAGNGKRIKFEAGEQKELGTLPPEVESADEEVPGWKIEAEENSKSVDEEDNGGEE